MSTDHRPAGEPRPSFEEALAQLELIVHELEEGNTPLAESLARYEHGIKLLKECYHLLENANRRIELLSQVDPAGLAKSEPFDDCALQLEEKAQARGRRRSRPANNSETPPPSTMDEPRGLF